MKKLKQPSEAVASMWKRSFMNDAAKFAGPTNLKPEDFHTEFTDNKGVIWKILGALEGKEMPCENVETKEIFIWDRWKVSELKHPEKHAAYKRKVEFIFPEPVKKKKTATKLEETESKEDSAQLNLFGSIDGAE